MVSKSHISNKLWSLFLVLYITKVCHGQLMCYVCENCPEVNTETPQYECNEDFFNTGGTTDSSVQTTTEFPSTTDGVTDDEKKSTTDTINVTESSTTTTTSTTTPTTTEIPTRTNEPASISTEADTTTEFTTATTSEPTKETVTETTIEPVTETKTTTPSTTENITKTEKQEPSSSTTEESRTTTTTEPQPPTPPTVGTPTTPATIPTPPNATLYAIDEHNGNDEVDGVEVEYSSTKAYKPSAAFRIRHLRAVSDVTYHCFKVQATTVNNTMVTNRGCSRVTTMESVCGLWKEQHPTEKMNKCFPCSNSKCNGSTALNVSITAMFIALIAVFLHRK